MEGRALPSNLLPGRGAFPAVLFLGLEATAGHQPDLSNHRPVARLQGVGGVVSPESCHRSTWSGDSFPSYAERLGVAEGDPTRELICSDPFNRQFAPNVTTRAQAPEPSG